ncbi:MAG: Ribosomal protein C-terminal domain [Verrucomicrobiota bacterium]|jgi:hypothetical protein
MTPKADRQYLNHSIQLQGLSMEYVPSRDVQDHLFAGEKIAAIKQLREETGLGLKESKDLVEVIDAQMRQEFPAVQFQPRSGGCLTMGLLLLGAGLACFSRLF